MRADPSDRISQSAKPIRWWKNTRRMQRILRKLARVTLFFVLAALIASVLLVLPFRWINPPVTAFMLADDRELSALRHDWVVRADIGESLALAVIASEDQRFFDHAGIDFASIKKSVEESRRGQGLRGASTITQQVAKNIYLWRGRSFVRKGMEAYLAVLVDLAWPKQRILEVYLNIAEFGPGIYGVGAASNDYFGKSPGAITDAEAALLAAVLPNPIRLSVRQPSDYVRERQRWIIGQMQRLRREQVLHAAGNAT